MNVLIVHAHHEVRSFNSSLKDLAVKTFSDNNHSVRVSDLYAMNFKAVADANDFIEMAGPDYLKYQIEQLNASNKGLFTEDIKTEMEKIEWADLIIFNFPLWWFSLPAILKGYVDRVFAMGFAYGGGRGVYDNGVFKGKKGMLTITTGGPAQTYSANGRNGDLDTILFHINHGMFYFIGLEVLHPFVVFSPVRLTDEERSAELSRYEQHLLSIETLQRIQFT
jgi:NAD(P)H dehydrogenase (quinone)